MKKFFSNLPYLVVAILLAPVLLIIVMCIVGFILVLPGFGFAYIFEYLAQKNYISEDGQNQFVAVFTLLFWFVWSWAIYRYDKYRSDKVRRKRV